MLNWINWLIFIKVPQQPETGEWRPVDKSPKFRGGQELRRYQIDGLNWLLFLWTHRHGCILADEMGLGKTIQAIAFLNHLVTVKSTPGPFLVVVPLATLSNWQREIESWTEMSLVLYHGDKNTRANIRKSEFFRPGTKTPKFNVLLTSYEFLVTDSSYLAEIDWRVVIIDEGHRIKNSQSKLVESLRQYKFDHRVLLTGTPIQNNVEELWALLSFIEPAKFVSKEEFTAEFADLQDPEQVQKLHKLMAPHILRRSV